MTEWQDRLRQRAGEIGMSQAALARATGIPIHNINKYFSAKIDHPRGDTVDRLAKALGVDTLWLRDGVDTIGHNNAKIETATIEVVGRVEAGAWRENGDTEELPGAIIPMGIGGKYPHAARFGLLVVGQSMNRVFHEGDIAICVSFADVGREIRDGDLVVAERSRAGLTETTIKRARINGDGRVKLWPESDRPDHAEPIPIEAPEEDTEVRVTGLVIGRYGEL